MNNKCGFFVQTFLPVREFRPQSHILYKPASIFVFTFTAAVEGRADGQQSGFTSVVLWLGLPWQRHKKGREGGGAGKLLTSVNCRCWRLFKKNKNKTNLKNAHFRRSGTQNNSYLKQFLFLIVHVLRVVCLCCERKCPHNATKWMLAARQVRTETAAGVSRWRMFNRNQKNVWLLNWRSHPLTSSALTGGMREHDAF